MSPSGCTRSITPLYAGTRAGCCAKLTPTANRLIKNEVKKYFFIIIYFDRFAERLILLTSAKFLPNLCKGVARSKVFIIFLFADAHEIHGIPAEDTISDTISV